MENEKRKDSKTYTLELLKIGINEKAYEKAQEKLKDNLNNYNDLIKNIYGNFIVFTNYIRNTLYDRNKIQEKYNKLFRRERDELIKNLVDKL